MTVELSNYGARVLAVRVPDRDGVVGDVTLGHQHDAGWMADTDPYFGCITGRYCNRIAEGRFELDGIEYQLATNNPPNHLHGGDRGFDKRTWDVEEQGADALTFRYHSPDGEEGYPGSVQVQVTYTLAAEENRLTIRSAASADKATPFSITNHTYFNLAGEGGGDVLSHRLQVCSDRYVPIDASLIPTGELAPVDGTPFDFRVAKALGQDIAADDEQLRRALGYDHCWVLGAGAGSLRSAAILADPSSGRVLKVSTTEPGVQVYSGNFLDGSALGKGGEPLAHRSGVCLETQALPDSPNQAAFPDAILRPGKRWESCTEWCFSTV